MTSATAVPPRSGRQALSRGAAAEAALVAVCCLMYSVLCDLAPASASRAFSHARQILRLEQSLGIDVELGLNTWLAGRPHLSAAAGLFYSSSFFLMTFGALIVLWIHRPDRYRMARNALFLMTGGAMIVYWAYPLAPPRLLPGGPYADLVATGSTVGSGYSKMFGELANPYAAMPSMHTGWSVWVAVALGAFVWKRWYQRLLLALHPLTTIWVILATGNHYVLDAVGGIVFFALGAAAVIAWSLGDPGAADRPRHDSPGVDNREPALIGPGTPG
ncbi:phosphatase PAP2 family protein [Actinomyces sp. B33]|uniref:phosphatase PAP2 family protein n=1 Tax=Actinomyces sp. B33 TaxID=2942131 RepID=UPI00234054ED|nr:phosphatase PAP2 family protein [Actinomyces sp. B33]MDC4233308.1 phosphatase PAP2 family protein [Actinomyces sp. B33]